MAKVGLTNGSVFSFMLKDWIAYAAWNGAKVVASPPHPDKKDEYSACTIHIEFTDSNEKPEPAVREAIYAASNIVQAIGQGRKISVEKLPIKDNEEAKYVITIKKQSPPSAQTDGSV